MSNTSKVTPRRQSSATAQRAMEYDGTDTPVLIRLPDLSVSHTSSLPRSSDALPATGHSAPDRKGRQRRVDRSHAGNRQQRRTQPSLPPGPWDRIPKSPVALAALILAVAGITYVLVPGNRQEQSPGVDPWAIDQTSVDQPVSIQMAMPSTDSTEDLWPEKGDMVTAQDPPPLQLPPGFDPQQSVARSRSQLQPDVSQGVTLAAPSGHVAPLRSEGFDQGNRPSQGFGQAQGYGQAESYGQAQASGPTENSGQTPVYGRQFTPVDGGGSRSVSARRVSNQTVEGWPDTPQLKVDKTQAIPRNESTPNQTDGVAPSLETSAPTTPVSSTPGYSGGPGHRTGMLPNEAGGSAESTSRARLDGTIRFPHPTTNEAPRRTWR